MISSPSGTHTKPNAAQLPSSYHAQSTIPSYRRPRSVEEPNAFRLVRAPPLIDPPAYNCSNHKDPSPTSFSSHGASPDAGTSVSPYATTQQDPHTPQPSHSDPTSWLSSTDLLSPNFNAHNFLQRVLSRCNDKSSRLTRMPPLDETFDADVALAALDTVEGALRRRRDAARRDEITAREDLRDALHISAKRQDMLVHSAHAVASHVSTFADSGRKAASALRDDLATMKTASCRLAALQDARDLLSLLSHNKPQLDAVRVSKLLCSAGAVIESGDLERELPEADVACARREVLRCERELTSSIFDWMKQAASSGNLSTISECALAAEQLGVSHKFIEAYAQHVFSFENATSLSIRGLFGGPPSAILDYFRNVCSESVSVIGDSVATVLESFSDPCRPLATVLQMVAKKKVLVLADEILSTLMQAIRNTEKKLKELKTSAGDVPLSSDLGMEDRRRSSLERMRSLAISDSKENWRENAQRLSDERRRYLVICADMFTSLCRLKSEMLDICRVPGAENIETVFAMLKDPFQEFTNRNLPQYLEVQKSWLDDRLGAAFFDITRIDLYAPRLAPREQSNADVYHRYRAFYGHVSFGFHVMTQLALRSVQESVDRTVAVFKSIPLSTDVNASASTGIGDFSEIATLPLSKRRDDTVKRQFSGRRNGGSMDPNLVCVLTNRNPSSLIEMRIVVRELLDYLVMNYLANVETLLQAATHLLPVCEKDATMAQLWISGASPLTAYIQAVDVLSKSNQLLDDFIFSLAIEEDDVDVSGSNLTTGKDLLNFIPIETREILHGELTSGLLDLSAEAQTGVEAAISSLRARLFSMLTTTQATSAYSCDVEDGNIHRALHDAVKFDEISRIGLDTEPSEMFISASTFLEQQLQSIMSSISGDNKQFVISEISSITREAVLHCWCNISGSVTISGALQMIADGKSIVHVFHDRGISMETMECLPAIGQLFLEGADRLWCCVESKSLANVEAHVIAALLQKRDDFNSERVAKVCQSLGADVDMSHNYQGLT